MATKQPDKRRPLPTPDSRTGSRTRPTALKVLEGGQGRDDEPQPASKPKVPQPPSHLGKEAKKVWKKYAPELHRLGLLTVLDEEAFAVLCTSFAAWREAASIVEGSSVLARQGQAIIQNPAFQAMNRMGPLIKTLSAQFGMTPAGRTAISVLDQAEADEDLRRLLSR